MIVCSEDVPYDVAARLAYEIDSGADRWGRCLLSLPRWLQRLVPAPRAFALFSLVCVLATFHIMHDIASVSSGAQWVHCVAAAAFCALAFMLLRVSSSIALASASRRLPFFKPSRTTTAAAAATTAATVAAAAAAPMGSGAATGPGCGTGRHIISPLAASSFVPRSTPSSSTGSTGAVPVGAPALSPAALSRACARLRAALLRASALRTVTAPLAAHAAARAFGCGALLTLLLPLAAAAAETASAASAASAAAASAAAACAAVTDSGCSVQQPQQQQQRQQQLPGQWALGPVGDVVYAGHTRTEDRWSLFWLPAYLLFGAFIHLPWPATSGLLGGLTSLTHAVTTIAVFAAVHDRARAAAVAVARALPDSALAGAIAAVLTGNSVDHAAAASAAVKPTAGTGVGVAGAGGKCGRQPAAAPTAAPGATAAVLLTVAVWLSVPVLDAVGATVPELQVLLSALASALIVVTVLGGDPCASAPKPHSSDRAHAGREQVNNAAPGRALTARAEFKAPARAPAAAGERSGRPTIAPGGSKITHISSPLSGSGGGSGGKSGSGTGGCTELGDVVVIGGRGTGVNASERTHQQREQQHQHGDASDGDRDADGYEQSDCEQDDCEQGDCDQQGDRVWDVSEGDDGDSYHDHGDSYCGDRDGYDTSSSSNISAISRGSTGSSGGALWSSDDSESDFATVPAAPMAAGGGGAAAAAAAAASPSINQPQSLAPPPLSPPPQSLRRSARLLFRWACALLWFSCACSPVPLASLWDRVPWLGAATAGWTVQDVLPKAAAWVIARRVWAVVK